MSDEDWYLESIRRGGTHFGRLEDGAVHARCGVKFTPQADLFGGGGVAVAMLPIQAEQACPDCCAQLGVRVEEVEAPRPNHARRDLGPLGTWVRRTPSPTDPPSAPAALPPVATPPPAPSPGKSWWFQRSANPGDTHWVISTNRGTKIAACGLSFQGKRVKNSTPTQTCLACEAKRPR